MQLINIVCGFDVCHDSANDTPAFLACLLFGCIQGLLDYLDCLSVGQLRQLFTLLSTLAFCGASDASHVADDMQIVIRKQLSNSRLKYKRMGVIGAVCLVGRQCATTTTPGGQTQQSSLSGQAYEQVS